MGGHAREFSLHGLILAFSDLLIPEPPETQTDFRYDQNKIKISLATFFVLGREIFSSFWLFSRNFIWKPGFQVWIRGKSSWWMGMRDNFQNELCNVCHVKIQTLNHLKHRQIFDILPEKREMQGLRQMILISPFLGIKSILKSTILEVLFRVNFVIKPKIPLHLV